MSAPKPVFKIAMVLYEQFDPIDIAGPFEVFAWLRNNWPDRQVQIDLVSESLQPPCTSTGLRLCPTTTFDVYAQGQPSANLIFVPGGTPEGFMAAMQNQRLLDFVKGQAARADYICSVCFGAFILGQAGLLEDCETTTYWTAVDFLHYFPRVKAAPFYPRYVVNSKQLNGRPVKIVTGGGVSSGIDEALKLAEMLAGAAIAEKVQLGIQYNPHPPLSSGDPTLADPNLWEPDLAGFKKQYEAPIKAIIDAGAQSDAPAC
jgi:cyclohexyl-isocyanide hydratase